MFGKGGRKFHGRPAHEAVEVGNARDSTSRVGCGAQRLGDGVHGGCVGMSRPDRTLEREHAHRRRPLHRRGLCGRGLRGGEGCDNMQF